MIVVFYAPSHLVGESELSVYLLEEIRESFGFKQPELVHHVCVGGKKKKRKKKPFILSFCACDGAFMQLGNGSIG